VTCDRLQSHIANGVEEAFWMSPSRGTSGVRPPQGLGQL